MNTEQITNIAIQLGQASQKAEMAIWVAIISAIAAVISASIAAYFGWKLNEANKQHEKQWAFINRRVVLIDNAIEVSMRIIFNKLLIADNNWPEAHQNFFVLQKEALVIDSQMAVYASFEVAEAFSDYRDFLVTIPANEIRPKWKEVIDRGRRCLLLCREHLGREMSEEFDEFVNKFVKTPPSTEGVVAATVNSSSFGGLMFEVPNTIHEKDNSDINIWRYGKHEG